MRPPPRGAVGGEGDVLNMFVAGDSLSRGMHATTEEETWVMLVADGLGNVELTRAERPHQTLAVVSSYADVPDDIDIAIIELGTNDVGIPTPDDEFREGYERLVGEVRDASGDAKLVCLGTWTGWGGQFDKSIQDVCEAADGNYVSLRDLFNADSTRGPEGQETFLGESDDFHPNNVGHAAIAKRVLKALDPLDVAPS